MRDPETLDPDAPLMSFGLDSLIAVEFARTLSREYGRPVPPDFAYSHPTLADAVTALSTRRTKTVQPAAISILAPRWTTLVPAPGPQIRWSVVGQSPIADALRGSLTEGDDNLVDLSALDGSRRDELFTGFLERLRSRAGPRITRRVRDTVQRSAVGGDRRICVGHRRRTAEHGASAPCVSIRISTTPPPS